MNAQELTQGGLEDGFMPLPTPDMDAEALFELGRMYSTGTGGAPLDLVSAHMILNLAAMRGSQAARDFRRELSREMEQDDIAAAQRAARQWIDQGRVALSA
ncbi:MAG: SEL1-like repeat protein [Brevundimonas sp.]|jgi:uncharacterized protein|uniref:SEL1-like repeat protein n=1 Tax=Brevundimonas sp. TaxID=1871086 RepID=UPI00391CF21F